MNNIHIADSIEIKTKYNRTLTEFNIVSLIWCQRLLKSTDSVNNSAITSPEYMLRVTFKIVMLTTGTRITKQFLDKWQQVGFRKC